MISTSSGPVLQRHRAGLVSRSIADVVDLVVVAAGVVSGYLLVGALSFLVRPRTFAWPHASRAMLLGVGIVVAVAYLAMGWSSTGRTLGKQLMGLRVVAAGGEVMGVATAVLRATLCVVFPIGLVWCALSRTNRSAQDVVLGTSVVYDWAPRTPDGRAGRRVLSSP